MSRISTVAWERAGHQKPHPDDFGTWSFTYGISDEDSFQGHGCVMVTDTFRNASVYAHKCYDHRAKSGFPVILLLPVVTQE